MLCSSHFDRGARSFMVTRHGVREEVEWHAQRNPLTFESSNRLRPTCAWPRRGRSFRVTSRLRPTCCWLAPPVMQSTISLVRWRLEPGRPSDCIASPSRTSPSGSPLRRSRRTAFRSPRISAPKRWPRAPPSRRSRTARSPISSRWRRRPDSLARWRARCESCASRRWAPARGPLCRSAAPTSRRCSSASRPTSAPPARAIAPRCSRSQPTSSGREVRRVSNCPRRCCCSTRRSSRRPSSSSWRR